MTPVTVAAGEGGSALGETAAVHLGEFARHIDLRVPLVLVFTTILCASTIPLMEVGDAA